MYRVLFIISINLNNSDWRYFDRLIPARWMRSSTE